MRTAQVFVPDCIVRASVFERVKSDIKLIISVHVWILLYLSLSGFIRSAIKQSWTALIRRKSLTCYKILLDTWGHSTRSHCWRAIAGGQIHNVLLHECRQELRLFFTLKTVVCCLSHSRTANSCHSVHTTSQKLLLHLLLCVMWPWLCAVSTEKKIKCYQIDISQQTKNDTIQARLWWWNLWDDNFYALHSYLYIFIYIYINKAMFWKGQTQL